MEKKTTTRAEFPYRDCSVLMTSCCLVRDELAENIKRRKPGFGDHGPKVNIGRAWTKGQHWESMDQRSTLGEHGPKVNIGRAWTKGQHWESMDQRSTLGEHGPKVNKRKTEEAMI